MVNSGYVQKIVSLIKSERGIDVDVVSTEGTDQRLYVQVIGIKGFPVFTINPTGKYDLPFEHTFTYAGMKKMGIPILDGETEGLIAVLFADRLAGRQGVSHSLCVGFDPIAIDRVRQMAETALANK